MLIAGSRLLNTPVMGLHTGSELARTERAIINPHTLEIIAYELKGPLLDMRPSILRIVDVREFSDIGIIVDSSDEFISPEDVVKLHEIYRLHFELVGKPVIDLKKRRLGKVDGYTVDTGGFVIQQLSVKRPFLKSFSDTHLLIHRSQIKEISDSQIVVASEVRPADPVLKTVRDTYTNPFRKTPRPQIEQNNERE